jgi:hypothetical protein
VSSAGRPIPLRLKIRRWADAKIARPADDGVAAAAYLRLDLQPIRSPKEQPMFSARSGLILAGLTFATWETIDIFWISVPAAAAVFAALFLSCTIWLWRRNSIRAALALMLLFAFEAAAVPTLKAMTVTKVADITLALTGIALSITMIALRGSTGRGHQGRRGSTA